MIKVIGDRALIERYKKTIGSEEGALFKSKQDYSTVLNEGIVKQCSDEEMVDQRVWFDTLVAQEVQGAGYVIVPIDAIIAVDEGEDERE